MRHEMIIIAIITININLILIKNFPLNWNKNIL